MLELTANGSAGGEFAGISMSSKGRLYAHYADGHMRALADVHLPLIEEEEDAVEAPAEIELGRRVA